jgi:hypothetical protein
MCVLSRELIHSWQQHPEILNSNNFTRECIISLFQPYFEQSCNILYNTQKSDQNRMEDIFPKHYFEFIIQHHNSDSVPEQNEHLIVDFRMLRDIFTHQLGRIVIQ